MSQSSGDSLGRRYLIKLFSNLATTPLYLVMEAVLPRALGPAAYGNFNFATALFQNFTNFLDMGTSTCLNTALAKRPADYGLASFYRLVALAVLALCLLAGLAMYLPGAAGLFMPGVPLWMALPAAFWAYITWAGRVGRGMNDALGFTWRSEPVRIASNLASVAALLALYALGLLSLPVLFGHQFLFLGLMALGFVWVLRRDWLGRGPVAAANAVDPQPGESIAANAAGPQPAANTIKGQAAAPPREAQAAASVLPGQAAARALSEPEGHDAADHGKAQGAALPGLDKEQRAAYGREFYRYSAPLFVIALCSALVLSGERWLLQFFDGSVEQGYFSLSQRIGVACFLFVTAMTPLLTRELAVAHGSGSRQKMADLLNRYAPMIYAVSAFMACFVLVEAPAVVRLFGGRHFADAVVPVQIMALYPIHQGYGQVAGAVFYATGQTRLLRNLTLVSLIAGLAAAWLLVAPGHFGGLGLGATGLAIKMVAVQFLAVNLFFFFGRKVAPFDFGRNLAHQIICPLVFAGLALAARYGTEYLGLGRADDLPRFFVSGALYVALCFVPAFCFPFALGLKRGELASQAARLGRWLKGRCWAILP